MEERAILELRLPPCCIDGVPHRYFVDMETEVEEHGYFGVGDDVFGAGKGGSEIWKWKTIGRW